MNERGVARAPVNPEPLTSSIDGMRTPLLVLAILSLIVAPAAAQSLPSVSPPAFPLRGDETVRPIGAIPIWRSSNSSGALVLRHASGGLVIAAEGGLLMTDAEGRTRWLHADPEALDVAAAPDGAVFSMAMFPSSRPTSVRVTRLTADGAVAWATVLHRRRLSPLVASAITAAPDGDVIVCSTVRVGPRRFAAMIDRLDRSGATRWSRTVGPDGGCGSVVTGPGGDIYWSGSSGSTGRASRSGAPRTTRRC